MRPPILDSGEIEALRKYLQQARDIKGLRCCLYIMFMRYHVAMAGSYHGVDNEMDSDFYADFGNLMEVLFILAPGPKDRESTNF